LFQLAQIYSNLLESTPTYSILFEHTLSIIIRINNVTKSFGATLVTHLSFVKNKATKSIIIIIMKIARENNDPFFLPYIKLSQARYGTNNIFLKKLNL